MATAILPEASSCLSTSLKEMQISESKLLERNGTLSPDFWLQTVPENDIAIAESPNSWAISRTYQATFLYKLKLI